MNHGHRPDVRALADQMLRDGASSTQIRAAVQDRLGVYVSKWTVNMWRSQTPQGLQPKSVQAQVARPDRVAGLTRRCPCGGLLVPGHEPEHTCHLRRGTA